MEGWPLIWRAGGGGRLRGLGGDGGRWGEVWPLIGRAGARRRLRELVLDDGCAGVVVAARAGVGKTRLGLECLAVAERAGLATARVMATRAAAGLPFGAVASLLTPESNAETGTAGGRADLLRRSATALVAQ